jgi:amino-acid N-acetyltransferase
MSLIGKASADDAPAILALVESMDLPTAGVSNVFGSFLVSRDGDAVTGCIGLESYGEVGLLRSLVVRSSERGTGTGGRLVDELLKLARDRGVKDLYLLTTTAEDYFPRFGFEVVDKAGADPRLQDSKEFQGACPETAVCMKRRLA